MTFQVQRERKKKKKKNVNTNELFPLLMFHCLILITGLNQGEPKRVLRRYREHTV